MSACLLITDNSSFHHKHLKCLKQKNISILHQDWEFNSHFLFHNFINDSSSQANFQYVKLPHFLTIVQVSPNFFCVIQDENGDISDLLTIG